MVMPHGVPIRQNHWDALDGILPTEPPTVTVVVPHFRQQAELDRTLLALRRQDHPATRLEIVVVDDGSPEPPRVPDGVVLLRQEDRGFRAAAARNRGAGAASGSVLCFLDADTSPEPGYVRSLTRLPALSSDVVAVGRRRHASFAESRIDVASPVENAGPRVELPEPRWLADAYRDSHDLLDADDRSYRFVIGAVSACSASLFRETGGYDEGFDRYGGEDWEWAYRVWLRGAVLAHVPEAVAWHDGPEWSDREGASRAGKNGEAQLLARLIPLPGSGFRGVRGDFADVAVTVPGAADGAAWFVAIDALAAELPLAAIPAFPGSASGPGSPSLERARLEVSVERPFRSEPGVVGDLVARVARDQIGSFEALSSDGSVVLRIMSTRARTRADRWGDATLFPSTSEIVPGLRLIDDEVDVEAYLGGWG